MPGLKPPSPVLNRAHPRAHGLFLALPFTERGGTKVRDLVGGRIPVPTGTPPWRSTPVGPGAVFALASSNRYEFADDPAWDVTNKLTVSALVVADTDSAFQTAVARFSNTAGAQSWLLGVNSTNGQWRWFVVNASGTLVAATSATSFATGRVRHLVGTYDGANIRLYVNGVQVASNTQTGNVQDGGIGVSIGQRSGGPIGTGWDGAIMDAKAWRRVLTPAEIAAEYVDPWALYKPSRRVIAAPSATAKPFLWHRAARTLGGRFG